MKRFLLVALVSMVTALGAYASDRTTRVGLSTSLLYERGWDATLLVERETRYHNAWEYFANVYLKWEDCPSCGHVCPESFWHSYNTWNIGFAYKPMAYRSRNLVGRMRFGASLGSDTDEVIGGIHLGYEQDYELRHGLVLFWQAKSDMIINGRDLFRTGLAIGIKIPVK
ncbi:MAG: hypothetical protein II544_04685 [Spirochaetales bacterium]|nr:hypothetical protein [Spirochaetales bacterium]